MSTETVDARGAVRGDAPDHAALDSADKGNLTEAWYRAAILSNEGETHVAARKDTLDTDQGIKLEKNRFVDIVDGGMAREIKSGEGKLGDADISQMHDYARMVDGQATLPTASGPAQIKHVRYTFTSPVGVKANVDTMRMAFTDKELRERPHLVRVVLAEREGGHGAERS